MTVSATPYKESYAGNGVTTAFPVNYYFLADTDLLVSDVNNTVSPAVTTVLVYGTDYTVTGAGVPAGGTVNTTVAPATGHSLTIYRSMDLSQPTHFVDGDPLPAAGLEQALDRMAMQIQQVQTEVETTTNFVETTLLRSELATDAANKGAALVRFDKLLTYTAGTVGSFLNDLGTAALNKGASLIGYLPPFTGAVGTTQQQVNNERVSVFRFMTPAQIADVQAGTMLQDVTSEIQKCIDWVIYQNRVSSNNGLGVVYLPAGVYKTSDTLQLGYGESFHSVTVEGDGRKYRGANAFTGTAIVPTFNDRPVFAVNGGRRSRIRHLSIRGLNYNWISSHNLGAFATPTLDDLNPANWVDSSFPASASSQYAPYCAVAIDPYAGVAPVVTYPAVTYPAWTGITTQYGKVFSSDTLIEDVEIGGFVVGVANQPCDADGNGDYTKLRSCMIEACQYGVSIGNTQSRLVHIDDSQIVNVYAALVTGVNGKKLGKPQILVTSTEIGACIKWVDLPTMGYGLGVKFIACYGEVIYSLGSASGPSSASPIAFDSCEFYFDWTHRGTPVYVFNYVGGGVSFRDCGFTADPIPNNYNFLGTPSLYRFENCQVNAGSNATKYYEKHALNATFGITVGLCGCNLAEFNVRITNLWNLNTGANLGAGSIGRTANVTNRKTCFPVYAVNIVAAENATSDPGFRFTSGFNAFSQSSATSITQSGKTVTADLTGSAGGSYQFTQSGGEVGDVVIDSTSNTVFFVAARTGLVLTLVAQNNLDASGNLKSTIGNTGYFYAMNCRRYTPTYVTTGDYTSGNVAVANVARADGYAGYLSSVDDGIQANDFIWTANGTAFNIVSPTGANIVSVGSGTFSLGGGLAYTGTKIRQQVFIRVPPANNT